jgi:hypothetical protein
VLAVADCGHPHAADVTRMLSGGPAVSFRTAAEKGTLYQPKVTLGVVSKPPVWRRVLVPADVSLGGLHQVIVAAMGWDGGHMHMFSDSITQYGPDGEDEDEDGMLEWLGLEDPSDFDPAAFDLAGVNARLLGLV